MSTIVLRPALVADLDAILRLAATVPESSQWTRGDFERALKEGEETEGVRRLLLLAEADGELAGFAAAGRVWDEADLENLAVLPRFRRQRIGRMLCMMVIAWTREFGAHDLYLEVRAGSAGARALYRSLGFAEEGTRRDYYRDPVEDAVLMRKQIGPDEVDAGEETTQPHL